MTDIHNNDHVLTSRQVAGLHLLAALIDKTQNGRLDTRRNVCTTALQWVDTFFDVEASTRSEG